MFKAFVILISFQAFLIADFKKAAAILEKHCVSCHNPDKTKGKLDLTSKEKILEKKNTLNPENSLILEVISGDEPEMPPKGPSLSKKEVGIISEWVKQGANWDEGRVLEDNPAVDMDWWSLKPIQKNTLNTEKNPVDYFVLKKLKQLKLIQNKEAKPEVLIRRVTYDLTGLPPTPKEISNFLKRYNENPEQAWQEIVKDLMARKSFGEKWGQHWLDVARYADTHGYDKDKLRRNAWPYRDYVIRSFNNDKSFKQFVQEQVAGDILFPDTDDGIIGLGFLAAGPWDFVGHVEVSESKIDGKIARHSDRDEMVSAVFNIFQSTTVQCAACHHHKFDPVRMEDYYRLHAVFSAVDRADRAYGGNIVDRKKIQKEISNLKNEKNKIESTIAKLTGKRKPQYGYHSKIEKIEDVVKWIQLDLKKAHRIKEINLIPAYDEFNDIGAGFGFPRRYKVEASNKADFSRSKVIYESKKDETIPEISVKFSVAHTNARYIRITATKLAERKDDFIFALDEIQVVPEESSQNIARIAKISSLDSIEAKPRWGVQNAIDDVFYMNQKVSTQSSDHDEAFVNSQKQDLAKLNFKIKSLTQILSTQKTVYAATTHFKEQAKFKPTKGNNRPIYLLKRGDVKHPGKKMLPGAPKLWSGAKTTFTQKDQWQEAEARKELANYLTHKDNPLIWRSMANRLWQWTFGQALVQTPNDFGRMGLKPSNPELLDYLAAQLRDSANHSMKSLIEEMVLSKTYRLSSISNKLNFEIDAGNRYFWRYNRRRLSAEEFRDSLLSITGKLNNKGGGPGFMDFVLQKTNHSPHYEYHLHKPDDVSTHKRSIYRFVVRSQPQPLLTTLDCADPSLSVAKRNESTTALQALAQWNNRFVEFAARSFAEKYPERSLKNLRETCVIVLGRLPSKFEEGILLKQLQTYGPANLARILFNMSAFTYVQ